MLDTLLSNIYKIWTHNLYPIHDKNLLLGLLHVAWRLKSWSCLAVLCCLDLIYDLNFQTLEYNRDSMYSPPLPVIHIQQTCTFLHVHVTEEWVGLVLTAV